MTANVSLIAAIEAMKVEINPDNDHSIWRKERNFVIDEVLKIIRQHEAQQPTEDVVERVATAIANRQRERIGYKPLSTKKLRNPLNVWEDIVDDAKAAIAAMNMGGVQTKPDVVRPASPTNDTLIEKLIGLRYVFPESKTEHGYNRGIDDCILNIREHSSEITENINKSVTPHLLPCPKCGAVACPCGEYSNGNFGIRCSECHIMNSVSSYARAIDDWNHRPLLKREYRLEDAVRQLWNAEHGGERGFGDYDAYKAKYPRDTKAHAGDYYQQAACCAAAWNLNVIEDGGSNA